MLEVVSEKIIQVDEITYILMQWQVCEFNKVSISRLLFKGSGHFFCLFSKMQSTGMIYIQTTPQRAEIINNINFAINNFLKKMANLFFFNYVTLTTHTSS